LKNTTSPSITAIFLQSAIFIPFFDSYAFSIDSPYVISMSNEIKAN